MDELGRVLMTIACADCDPLPKVADAGRIIQADGCDVQVMHNGVHVVAGGYHGEWMAHIIRALRGHHEPQEELLFAHLLRLCRHNSVMVELGAFWAYYSLWYLAEVPGSRALCVEPDPGNLAIGRRNAGLNGLSGRVTFAGAAIGGKGGGEITLLCESSGETKTVACLDMDGVLGALGDGFVEMLHLDAQGAELPFLSSISAAAAERVRFLVVSTHHRCISGSATTHEDCIAAIRAAGGYVMAEHSVQESFSGDGLIVASFLAQDRSSVLPPVSRNVAERSLFPHV